MYCRTGQPCVSMLTIAPPTIWWLWLKSRTQRLMKAFQINMRIFYCKCWYCIYSSHNLCEGWGNISEEKALHTADDSAALKRLEIGLDEWNTEAEINQSNCIELNWICAGSYSQKQVLKILQLHLKLPAGCISTLMSCDSPGAEEEDLQDLMLSSETMCVWVFVAFTCNVVGAGWRDSLLSSSLHEAHSLREVSTVHRSFTPTLWPGYKNQMELHGAYIWFSSDNIDISKCSWQQQYLWSHLCIKWHVVYLT